MILFGMPSLIIFLKDEEAGTDKKDTVKTGQFTSLRMDLYQAGRVCTKILWGGRFPDVCRPIGSLPFFQSKLLSFSSEECFVLAGTEVS
jgi:hypothetical protein